MGCAVSRSRWQASRIAGPPARWIAPSTPPPPSNDELAALTTASISCVVMSPRTKVIMVVDGISDVPSPRRRPLTPARWHPSRSPGHASTAPRPRRCPFRRTAAGARSEPALSSAFGVVGGGDLVEDGEVVGAGLPGARDGVRADLGGAGRASDHRADAGLRGETADRDVQQRPVALSGERL